MYKKVILFLMMIISSVDAQASEIVQALPVTALLSTVAISALAISKVDEDEDKANSFEEFLRTHNQSNKLNLFRAIRPSTFDTDKLPAVFFCSELFFTGAYILSKVNSNETSLIIAVAAPSAMLFSCGVAISYFHHRNVDKAIDRTNSAVGNFNLLEVLGYQRV